MQSSLKNPAPGQRLRAGFRMNLRPVGQAQTGVIVGTGVAAGAMTLTFTPLSLHH